MPYVFDQNGQRYEEPSVSLARQHEYFNQNFPRILKPFSFKVLDNVELAFGGHGEIINKGYLIGCDCGSENFSASAVHWNDQGEETYLLDPLVLKCKFCDIEIEAFNNLKYGYDAEHGHHGDFEKEEHEAPNRFFDSNEEEKIVFVCHYSDEEFEFDRKAFVEGSSVDGPRPENCFSWFTLGAMKNGVIRPIFDCECA